MTTISIHDPEAIDLSIPHRQYCLGLRAEGVDLDLYFEDWNALQTFAERIGDLVDAFRSIKDYPASASET